MITVANHKIVGRVTQASPFCPNIAATPDGKQVWFTLKDTGKTEVFDAHPPFSVLKTLETGPITNHVNIVHNAHGTFAYVTVGGLNEVKVFRTDTFSQVATIPVGPLPHGLWPSGDGTRIYTGLENGDRLVTINTLTNKVMATSPIGQGCQAIAYVPNAVPSGAGTQGSTGWSPRVDVYETDKEIVVKAEVPGAEPEDVELYCTPDAVVLRGEIRHEDERPDQGHLAKRDLAHRTVDTGRIRLHPDTVSLHELVGRKVCVQRFHAAVT